MSEITQIKRYKVKEVWKEYEVTLEVDHSILTIERATMLNDFWSNSKFRLIAEDNDVVRTVIRNFGQIMINMMLAEGGASFVPTMTEVLWGNPGPAWSDDIHDEEGWGGRVEGSFYGWCGICVIAADVECPSFDDVELVEVTNG